VQEAAATATAAAAAATTAAKAAVAVTGAARAPAAELAAAPAADPRTDGARVGGARNGLAAGRAPHAEPGTDCWNEPAQAAASEPPGAARTGGAGARARGEGAAPERRFFDAFVVAGAELGEVRERRAPTMARRRAQRAGRTDAPRRWMSSSRRSSSGSGRSARM
jgi:hypothetical protein